MEIKEIKKLKKNLPEFYCELCDFKCTQKNDWNRHIQRLKHLRKSNGNDFNLKNLKNDFTCQNCNSKFKTSSGLWKHNKKCYIGQVNSTNIHNVSSGYSNQITIDKDIFMTMIKESSEIKTLLCKVLENGTNNVNNSYNNNKTFNIQVFLHETCKNAMNITDFVNSIKPTLEDLENVGRLGYAEGISEIIINSLNKIAITERPIHCSDVKREVIYIKNNDTWTKEEHDDKPVLLKAIKDIANKNMKNINEWTDLNPDCTYSDSRKNDIYLKIVSNSMCGLTKEETNKNLNAIISRLSKKVTISDYKNNLT